MANHKIAPQFVCNRIHFPNKLSGMRVFEGMNLILTFKSLHGIYLIYLFSYLLFLLLRATQFMAY
jgi:hypothetical protein